jgi:RNA polymerase sigma-70 factor (ECF subfamily)
MVGRVAPADADPARAAAREPVARAFREHERLLWQLCYRMTGCAADADDLVQETFARALARPPARPEAPWRPWLVRVAMNLARDLLRRRRRSPYVGPWLPSPVGTEDDAPPAYEPVLLDADGRPVTTEGRYDLLESVSFAFLLALEALTARQRAVLLLRDVFDYSVRQTADALGLSAESVRTTHGRARRAMRAYDRERMALTRELRERTGAVLSRFLEALASRDRTAVEALLAADVRMLSDGAGEVHAARVPIVGRERVTRFWMKVGTLGTGGMRLGLRTMNGLPAVVVERDGARGREPRRVVVACTLDAAGRIRRVYSVLASRKLSAVLPLAP